MFEAIGAKILAWIMSSQGVVTIIVSAIVTFLGKKFPREKLFGFIKPVAILVGFSINTFLLKIFPKQLAIKVEQGFFCTILYCCKQFFEAIEYEILKDNAIEVKESILPKKEAVNLLKATKEKNSAEKIIKEIQVRHNRSEL